MGDQPLAFNIYTSLHARRCRFPLRVVPSALDAISGGDSRERSQPYLSTSRGCLFAKRVTRVLRRMPFRAAACTGACITSMLY